MPHLIEAVASGATSSTILRSAKRMSRSWRGCFAKNPSIGAPKSARRAAMVRAGGVRAALLPLVVELLARVAGPFARFLAALARPFAVAADLRAALLTAGAFLDEDPFFGSGFFIARMMPPLYSFVSMFASRASTHVPSGFLRKTESV